MNIMGYNIPHQRSSWVLESVPCRRYPYLPGPGTTYDFVYVSPDRTNCLAPDKQNKTRNVMLKSTGTDHQSRLGEDTIYQWYYVEKTLSMYLPCYICWNETVAAIRDVCQFDGSWWLQQLSQCVFILLFRQLIFIPYQHRIFPVTDSYS